MIISNELIGSLVKASKKTEIHPFDDINRVRYTSTIETGKNNKMGGGAGKARLSNACLYRLQICPSLLNPSYRTTASDEVPLR